MADNPSVATLMGECGKCFQQRPVALCCAQHGIAVCHPCYVAHVGDVAFCDLFGSSSNEQS